MQPATDEPEESRAFRTACLRAFAGTRWKPVKMTSYTHLKLVGYRVTIQLDMVDHLGTVPYDEFVPRSAARRDPRFLFRRRRRG